MCLKGVLQHKQQLATCEGLVHERVSTVGLWAVLSKAAKSTELRERRAPDSTTPGADEISE